MTTGTFGSSPLPASSGERALASMSASTSSPSTTRPKTTCLPLNFGMAAKVMKNCEVFEFFPWFPMEFFIHEPGPGCKSNREQDSHKM